MQQSVADFKAEMDRRFGSDEALGVWFELDDGGSLTVAQFEELFARIGREAMPGTESKFPDGTSACCCTAYANQIYRGLPGRVKIFGFTNKDNPTSRIAREEVHPGGHDFAVVDDRFIVDPWPRLVPAVFDQMVFDLEDPEDRALALDIYGPRDCWEHMTSSEAWAEELANVRDPNAPAIVVSGVLPPLPKVVYAASDVETLGAAQCILVSDSHLATAHRAPGGLEALLDVLVLGVGAMTMAPNALIARDGGWSCPADVVGMVPPTYKTYGPPRKGRGGKIQRW